MDFLFIPQEKVSPFMDVFASVLKEEFQMSTILKSQRNVVDNILIYVNLGHKEVIKPGMMAPL